MEDLIKKYELLTSDVKYQMTFITNFNDMEFQCLKDTLTEMEEVQKLIIKKQLEEHNEKLMF